MKNKKFKKAIWMYAVVLFTSAFILLLFTYFSQNQFTKSEISYKSRILEEEKKRKSAQSNLNSVSEEINRLNNDIYDCKDKISKLEGSQKASEAEIKKQKELQASMVKSYENLLDAENQYMKGNLIESATILLKSCDRKLYDAIASEKYDNLVVKTFSKASQQLYSKALSDYKSKKYYDAINKFELSISLNKTSYTADDCYYFIAYSYLNLGNYEMVKKNLNELLINYPNSTYSNESLRIIKQLPD